MFIHTDSIDTQSLEFSIQTLLRDFPALYQLIISRKGEILLERTNSDARENTASRLFRNLVRLWAERFSGPPETFQHQIGGRSNLRSATKSIVALLTGMALQEGLIPSLDSTLGELLPDDFQPDSHPAKREITLRHLLTMASGLASMESGINAFKMFSQPSWVRFMLDLPLASLPGTTFLYNSANPHLLSAVFSRLSGESLLTFANRTLFGPLGIENVVWGPDPEGITFGGGNLFLNAEELRRVGELCLQRGHWQGRQLIPAAWFDEMWQPYREYFPGWKYGYYWYLHEEWQPRTNQRVMTYSAAGSGGQKLLLIPDLDLVLSAVALTDFIGERGMALNQFISTELLKAIK